MTLAEFISIRSEYQSIYNSKLEKYKKEENLHTIGKINNLVDTLAGFAFVAFIGFFLIALLCFSQNESNGIYILEFSIALIIAFLILEYSNKKMDSYYGKRMYRIRKRANKKAREKISKKYQVEFYVDLEDDYDGYQLHKNGQVHIPSKDVLIYLENGIKMEGNAVKSIKTYIFKIKYIEKDGTCKNIMKEFPTTEEINTRYSDLIFNESDL